MRSVTVAIVSVAILAGSYLYAFGVPQPLVQVFGQPASAEANNVRAGGQSAVREGGRDKAQTEGAQQASKPNAAQSGAGQGAATPGGKGEVQAGAGAKSSGAPGGGAGSGGGRRNNTTVVKTAILEEQPYTLILRTIGTARSRTDVNVTSGQAGEIVELTLEANKIVARGDVLLKLDDETERLSLQIAEATRDKALDTASRYRSLRSSGNLSVTQAELADAELDLNLAQASVGLAQHNLDQRTFHAPINGRLGLDDLQVGDRVSVGDLIVTIDDASTLLAEFEVPERSMALLEVGREVLVSTPTYAGRVFKGRVTAFDSRLDSVTRSATVQAEIDNKDDLLLSGMTFSVRMIDKTDPLPVVPATAITWTREGAGIWTVENDRASRQPVAIRFRNGNSVWVDTPVAPGASIVVEGAAKLRAGAQVRSITEDADKSS